MPGFTAGPGFAPQQRRSSRQDDIVAALLKQGRSTAPAGKTEALARLAQGLLGGFLQKQQKDDRLEATSFALQGASAQPFLDPDIDASGKPRTSIDSPLGAPLPDQGPVGGAAGALSALGRLPDNSQASELVQQLLGGKIAQDQAIATRNEQRTFDAGLLEAANQRKDAQGITTQQRKIAMKELPLTPEQLENKLKLRRAGKPVTNINVNNTAESAFAKAFGKGDAELFADQRVAAQDAVKSLQSTGEAEKLLDAGIITGFGADFKIGFGKALQQAGFSFQDDEIANTEAFAASRAAEVGRIIKLFGAGTGLSDADREFATQAAAGKITLTEKSIRRILDINKRASRNVIKLFNEKAAQLPQGISPFTQTIEGPPEAAGGAQEGMIVDNPITGESLIFRNGEWVKFDG